MDNFKLNNASNEKDVEKLFREIENSSPVLVEPKIGVDNHGL